MVDVSVAKKSAIEMYVAEISKQFATGNATEHSYRPALTDLLKALLPHYTVTNEPARIECGAPDFILAKGPKTSLIPVAFVEAKDVGDPDLDGNKKNKEQFSRYKKSLDHILFTDYLDFHLYEGEQFVDSVRIAEVKGNKIVLNEAELLKFLEIIENLAEAVPQKITSSANLAKMMANKARLLAEVIEKSLAADDEKTGELAGQWKSFQKVLIHDLTGRQFADIYAQTICYGMFAARLHDETPDTFSRSEAAELIPKTNPFLRKVFQNVATFDIDDNIAWIVDDLVETFRVTDMPKVMKNFGKSNGQTDPMIHFYEDFLRCYDPKQKKACGVYYTPEPVVKFIVNAVNEILQNDFNLPSGLADTSRVLLDRAIDGTYDKKSPDHKVHEKREYHKVQILDPATGTGTFLAEVVRKIHSKMENQQGAWQSYVEEHLLPRLNGFEFMMAPYAVAHLKLDMVLGETGYKAMQDKRLRIFLTNSLEEHDPDTGTLFAQWLAQEANEANLVKRDTPVMVMIGNPPYSGESANKGKWILDLLNDYKKEPGGIEKLKEKNPKWINDDYCKFIRLGQYYVDKNGEGVLAFINNNSFLDNPTFRGMRWSLMKSFDEIYILDLHGNSKKQEICPDGSKDENVFDIMQGVSINIFVKKNVPEYSEESSKTLAKVFHYDLFGKREEKYEYLVKCDFKDISWTELTPFSPYFFLIPQNDDGRGLYNQGFSIDEILKDNSMGVTSGKDKVFISENEKKLLANVQKEFHFADKNFLKKILYRPFDNQYIYYDSQKLARAREKNTQKYYAGKNISLCSIRINSRNEECTVFVTDKITDKTVLSSKDNANVFPLYLYPTEGDAALGATRKPNLDETIWKKIDECIKTPDQVGGDSNAVGDDNHTISTDNTGAGNESHETTPEQIFDYIYGVLHTPSYRERYKEFLKIDFPRIPYPSNKEQFDKIVALGTKLRKLHLMEEVPPVQTSFNEPGDNLVTELRYEPADDAANEGGKVFINASQYFGNVPKLAWNFYIGGYQPAQKWLKDRKGRTLSFDDISHYQKIIAILLETDNLMRQLG